MSKQVSEEQEEQEEEGIASELDFIDADNEPSTSTACDASACSVNSLLFAESKNRFGLFTNILTTGIKSIQTKQQDCESQKFVKYQKYSEDIKRTFTQVSVRCWI